MDKEMEMMKKIFISDLHLGDGSKSDDFHRDKELYSLLARYGMDSKIILLGDIFELWQARLDKILWAHSLGYNLIEGCINKCVYGNHDYLPFSKLWDESYEDELIYAEHGHQHDVYNNTSMFNLKWPIGKYLTVAVGWLEKLWHKDVDEFLLKKYGEFKYTAAKLQSTNGNVYNKNGVWYRYIAYPEPIPNDKQIYIYGHTHKAKLFKNDDNKIIANCGAWVDGVEPTYVEVEECETQNVVVVRLRNGITYEIIKEEIL